MTCQSHFGRNRNYDIAEKVVQTVILGLAKLGFTIWGIYKGVWVLRRVWTWCEQKFTAWKAERAYINGMAAYIRLEREK